MFPLQASLPSTPPHTHTPNTKLWNSSFSIRDLQQKCTCSVEKNPSDVSSNVFRIFLDSSIPLVLWL